MDRRTALAIGLMLIVALLPAILSPPKRPPPGAASPVDTARARPVAPVTVVTPPVEVAPGGLLGRPALTPETLVSVESPLYRFIFSTNGARLKAAVLKEYRTFAPGEFGPAQVIPPESRFLEYSLVFGDDTVSLADWAFEPSTIALTVRRSGSVLEWVGRRGPVTVRLRYMFLPERYLFDVQGQIEGVDATGFALVRLGPRLAFVEADSVDDFRAYGVVTKASKTSSLSFKSLDFNEVRALGGPFEWVAVKSKYFLSAVMTIDEDQLRFGGALATGGPRSFGTPFTIIPQLPQTPMRHDQRYDRVPSISSLM